MFKNRSDIQNIWKMNSFLCEKSYSRLVFNNLIFIKKFIKTLNKKLYEKNYFESKCIWYEFWTKNLMQSILRANPELM